MVEGGEVGGWPGGVVEQAGGEHAHLALGSDDADQAHHDRGSLAFVVSGIRAVVWRQRDDGFRPVAKQECSNGLAADAVDAHAEVDGALLKGGNEPGGGVTAIEDEQVLLAQQFEVFEQHLSLVGIRTVQRRVQHHLYAGQVQCEDLGVLDDAARGIAGGQAQVAGVGGDHAQAAPARHAEVLLDERKQMGVQVVEDGVRQMLASLGQSLGAGGAREVGLIAKYGEEAIEFSLYAGVSAAEEPANQRDEIEDAAMTEVPTIREMTRA